MARILVVDDDASLREAVRTLLQQEGFEVDEAEEGTAALRMSRLKPYDLIVCDVYMPGMDGIEVIRQLRRESKSTTIIAMSGGLEAGRTDLLGVAKHLGAAEILYKPFKLAQLVEAIHRCLPKPQAK